jgi:tetratricopeptide (TPR) repeat protein
MGKPQIWAIAGAIALFLMLYLGFGIVPPKQKDVEKSRSNNIESTGINNLIQEASPHLDGNKKSVIEALNLDLEKSKLDTNQMLKILKSLSGTWLDFGFPAISGHYAENIADIQNSDTTWSIAGTTYALCVKSDSIAKTKEFCSKRAVKAFEKAVSLSPQKIEHRINLAICYVDNPNQQNPMQGIMMLRDLNTQYPNNVEILNQLGKLAIQTNQTDKAIKRLEDALAIEPDNNVTICLLVQAYSQIGNAAKAEEFRKKCVN